MQIELIPVRASERTVWLFVRLTTPDGITGLGEASDAFGFANTTADDIRCMESALNQALTSEAPPRNLVEATAHSAIEQALWDIAGKERGVPTWQLLGDKLRDRVPVYANINRATKLRTPAGFAATARRAYEDGFRAFKAAPFDGYPKQTIEHGVASMYAIREAVGSEALLMIDCHAFFDVAQSIDIARSLEPCNLHWFEEPVPPENTAATRTIRTNIQQNMAGGELLFGVEGFEPLVGSGAVETIMPDVKHCGGLRELIRIAAMARERKIQVAPHNPSGPVATAASVQACAVIPNCTMLELQWGEVQWRPSVLTPPEIFEDGTIAISNRPGFGIELNECLFDLQPGPIHL